MSALPNTELGCVLPYGIPHAISSSLRRWKYINWWADKDERIVSKLTSDYPRFVIHILVRKLRASIVDRYCVPDEDCLPFPTMETATTCINFLRSNTATTCLDRLRLVHIAPLRSKAEKLSFDASAIRWTTFWVVVFHKEDMKVAQQVWQHRGEGMSSRQAEFCLALLEPGYLAAVEGAKVKSEASAEVLGNGGVSSILDPVILPDGKDVMATMQRRIAALASVDRRQTPVLPDDVFLYPSGMSAIAHGVDALCDIHGRDKKFIIFGTTYSDTRPVIEKFGPGSVYLGGASDAELDELELRLKLGERFTALVCETPGNPMLTSPDLVRIKKMSEDYGFLMVIDETVGTWVNVDALKFADMTFTSLSKSFSGACNVLGGCIVINNLSPAYETLRKHFTTNYINEYFPLDAIVMESNSRDFVSRVRRMNSNAATLAAFLVKHIAVKEVRYPALVDQEKYGQIRRPTGGNSMLLSIIFHKLPDAVLFYDHLECSKGATLGTNFTLANAFVLMAMKPKLAEVKKFGIVEESVRVSVGLEDPAQIIAVFQKALNIVVESWAQMGMVS
ncbi:PLP-dependent transferase [Ascodesmis nigricans]|uniref:PLP-dependent transferase n=1 Tax=Ascodesmis nigricans TaxID=341454 RepID=A0A4S2MUC5_9PEZI|nr:PLP-dependent transferase [Ascodesmis nigricans]